MPDRILVPIDHSTQAWNALEYAFEAHPAAHFVVLHVVQPVDFVLEGEVYGATQQLSRAEAAAEEIQEEVRDLAGVFDVEVEPRIAHGRPGSAIVETADEAAVDHVIVGSHGRSGVSRILLGSVAEYVVRRSAVPVTVVR